MQMFLISIASFYESPKQLAEFQMNSFNEANEAHTQKIRQQLIDVGMSLKHPTDN